MEISNYIKTLRPEQWYKNLLVFLAIIYSFSLLDFKKLNMAFLGFIVLSVLSSANYIFNDIIDKKNDVKNNLKSDRTIASGKVSIKNAFAIFFGLLAAGWLASFGLGYNFFLLMVSFVAISTAYTLYLKKEMFVDILAIAINFAIRAVSGAVLIGVYVSPWLILCPSFLSLFISVGKRRAETSILGKNALKYRSTLSYYTEDLTNSLMIITTTILIVSYTFYTLSMGNKLILTLPVVLYGIFRYFKFVYQNPLTASKPELVFKDARLMLALILWAFMTIALLYLNL